MITDRRTAMIGAAGMAASLIASAAQAQAPQGGVAQGTGGAAAPGPKPATAATRAANEALRRRLPFNDTSDFESARRGFVAALPEPVRIPGRDGNPVWNLEPFNFVQPRPDQDAPDTVNPSLWRQAKLLLTHGLFQVTEGMWQVRGYDLSTMTIMRGERGWIVVDPFVTEEVARHVWRELVVPNIGDRPITAIIYTHSHIDHYGGVRGIVRQEDVDAGRVAVLAPANFTEAAVSENVMAGNVMTRRAAYMYGNLVGPGPQGMMTAGLGISTSTGNPTLIVPTDFVTRTGETKTLDGVELRCILAPESEAPAEFMFYLPRFRVFHAAEDLTRTMHNLYTLRGAKYRNALLWSRYLHQAIEMFGNEMEIAVNSHHFPTWGREACIEHISKQRDMLRHIHDQTLRMANKGMTPLEIGEAMELPESLDRFWPNRPYYGTLYHNARSQYGLYLGWFDGVPAHLHEHAPVEAGKRYVSAMGGGSNVLRAGRQAFEQGDYRWAAQLVNHLVFAEPDNREARELVADAYEQLGYQAESGPWRNFYLTGAKELREGVKVLPTPNTASPDTVKAMPTELLLDYLGVRLIPEKAAGKKLTINLDISEPAEKFVLGVENSTLNWSADRQAQNADATLSMSRAALNEIMQGERTLEQQIMNGRARVTGNARAIGDLVSMLDTFEIWFNIVTP